MDANKEIKEANEKYKEMISDEETRRLAVKRHLALMEMAAAKNDGYQEGIEKGKEIGLKEGKAEGKMNEKQEIAKNMLKKNFDLEVIADITGLTKEEIEKIK